MHMQLSTVPQERIEFHGDTPPTDRGLLMCAPQSAVTPHVFVGRAVIRDSLANRVYDQLVYRCAKCGNNRVWGTEA